MSNLANEIRGRRSKEKSIFRFDELTSGYIHFVWGQRYGLLVREYAEISSAMATIELLISDEVTNTCRYGSLMSHDVF